MKKGTNETKKKARRRKVTSGGSGSSLPVQRHRVTLDSSTVRTRRPTAKKIVQLERDKRAFEMRKAGVTYQQIGDTLGLSTSAAFNAVKRMMKHVIVEATSELRAVQYERLNHMLMMVWSKVNAGDERAITLAMSLIDQINKMMGVDVPQAQEIKHSGGVLVIQTNTDDYIHGLMQMSGHEDTSQVQEPKMLTQGDQADKLTDIIETSGVLEGEEV